MVAADEGGGYAIGFAHHQVGRRCELIGDSDLGDLQVTTNPVGCPLQVDNRLQPGDADGDVGQPPAPGAAKRVGDHHGKVDAETMTETRPDAVGRPIWILGEQDHRARIRIGAVDSGVGTDETVLGFGDYQVASSSHYRDGFGFHQGELELSFVTLDRDHPTLGLGHDLVGHDDNVSGHEAHRLQGPGEDLADVIAGPDESDPNDG